MCYLLRYFHPYSYRPENPNFTAIIVQLIALIIAMPYGISILDVDLVTKRASTDMLLQIHLSLVSSTQVLCRQHQSSLKFLGCSTLLQRPVWPGCSLLFSCRKLVSSRRTSAPTRLHGCCSVILRFPKRQGGVGVFEASIHDVNSQGRKGILYHAHIRNGILWNHVIFWKFGILWGQVIYSNLFKGGDLMAQLVWHWSCQPNCRWCFESLLVHSGVSSTTRRKATGADHKKRSNLFKAQRPGHSLAPSHSQSFRHLQKLPAPPW